MIFLFVAILLVGTTGLVRAVLLEGPNVIAPPAVIADVPPGATNQRQQAFNERQAVTINGRVRCSYGAVSEGDVVNSHMIFYNTPFQSPETDANRVWTFDGEIVCIMAERSGLYQGQTDGLFGAPGTLYPGPFEGRGLERDGVDSVSYNGNQLTLTMRSEQPGDWVRVLTKVAVPDDDTPPVVFCEPRSNPADKGDNKGQGTPGGPYVTLIGADNVDGEVDIYVTDVETETVFGPFAAETIVQINTAKGAVPQQLEGQGSADYRLRVQGPTTISATDVAGNEGSAACTN